MAASTIYLFTGENTYALGLELSRWKKGFAEKHGAENLLTLQGKDVSVSDLLDAVSVMPFIAEKRLVVLEGVPRIEKEDFQNVVLNLHPQTILAIVEPKPDKRLGIVKEIEKSVEIKSFSLLSPASLKQWIRSFVSELNAAIEPDAIELLLDIVGTDQWTLDTEIRKIVSGSNGTVRTADVQSLAIPSGTQVIWKLTDLIGSKKANEAIAFMKNRIDRGEDVYGLWTILLSMIKNLTLVFAAVNEGHSDERSVASATGLHFMSARGLLPLAKSMTKERLESLVRFAANADIELKSGGYHYASDRTDEVIALAERMVLMTAH